MTVLLTRTRTHGVVREAGDFLLGPNFTTRPINVIEDDWLIFCYSTYQASSFNISGITATGGVVFQPALNARLDPFFVAPNVPIAADIWYGQVHVTGPIEVIIHTGPNPAYLFYQLLVVNGLSTTPDLGLGAIWRNAGGPAPVAAAGPSVNNNDLVVSVQWSIPGGLRVLVPFATVFNTSGARVAAYTDAFTIGQVPSVVWTGSATATGISIAAFSYQ